MSRPNNTFRGARRNAWKRELHMINQKGRLIAAMQGEPFAKISWFQHWRKKLEWSAGNCMVHPSLSIRSEFKAIG